MNIDYMMGWMIGFGLPLVVVLGSFRNLFMRRK